MRYYLRNNLNKPKKTIYSSYEKHLLDLKFSNFISDYPMEIYEKEGSLLYVFRKKEEMNLFKKVFGKYVTLEEVNGNCHD